MTERTGQQAGAGEHLEAVADADHRAAIVDERAQRLTEASAGGGGEIEGEEPPGAERVAVAEAARDHGDVVTTQR